MRRAFVNTAVLARPVRPILTVAVLAFAASGCGSTKPYTNDPRPAQPIVVAAAIAPGGISVSPERFGAGLVQLVVTNLTNSSQQLEIVSRGQSSGGTPRLQQQTGPINPQDTASLKANLGKGDYTVRVSDHAIKAAVVTVGVPRPSSQNQLLQP
jgi:hypothetical protein